MVNLDVPIWEDESLVEADEAFWVGLINLVAERNAAVIASRREHGGEDLPEKIWAERNGKPVTRWVCDLRQTSLKGIESVAKSQSGCCSDLAAFRAGEAMADEEGDAEVALEDGTGKGRPYHAIVLIDGRPDEQDVSEYFGMGATR